MESHASSVGECDEHLRRLSLMIRREDDSLLLEVLRERANRILDRRVVLARRADLTERALAPPDVSGT